MALHPRPAVLALLCAAALAAGCAPDRSSPARSAASPLAPEAPAGRIAHDGAADVSAARARMKLGHPYFPLTPGRYVDFRIQRLGEDPEFSYVRATLGEPEMFFGRLATPLVYSEIPGMLPDEIFDGLRQYYSIAPDRALWWHGAQNKGVMSHMEPPVRQLPADVVPGATWQDTTFFESFLPGMIPFWSNHERWDFALSERAVLELVGGIERGAVRVDVVITDTYYPGALIAAAALDGVIAPASQAGRDEAPFVVQANGGPKSVPEVKKGLWFARHEGLVARDFPFGPGDGIRNIVTFEKLAEGTGPVPAAQPAP
jgi:hypothetical protein